jgi:hypothetical protein
MRIVFGTRKESFLSCYLPSDGRGRFGVGRMWRNATAVYRPTIGRPRVLLLVAHPTVGSALESLLRIEGRYDVRRLTKVADGVAAARGWQADAAVVDSAVLPPAEVVTLGIPSLVLLGDGESSEFMTNRLDRAHGFVRRDAPPHQLFGALDRVLPKAALGSTLSLTGLIVAMGVALLGLYLLYLLWLAVA